MLNPETWTVIAAIAGFALIANGIEHCVRRTVEFYHYQGRVNRALKYIAEKTDAFIIRDKAKGVERKSGGVQQWREGLVPIGVVLDDAILPRGTVVASADAINTKWIDELCYSDVAELYGKQEQQEWFTK